MREARDHTCPDCGGEWNVNDDPDACPNCGLTIEDIEAAAHLLADLESRVPAPKCERCGTRVTAVDVRLGERTGYCTDHGRVIVVDRFAAV